ncbi:hypothetical protein P691DRAFT_392673 [Macrolepiota fuliginosa MF-IS2]|uniref:Histidine kinase n=1 Tax=Macrolepiota fuliginosa MF-IS2 TaxID=1400762 RepID=A0A9P6C744_9AGAR|nr:hypothetical protein P691DRAFT_392673 [Macrolepiota fuliginosa MF-IS2]
MPALATSAVVNHILPPPAAHPPDSPRTRAHLVCPSFGTYWTWLKRQFGAGAAPSNICLAGDSTVDPELNRCDEQQFLDEGNEMDEIVVDQEPCLESELGEPIGWPGSANLVRPLQPEFAPSKVSDQESAANEVWPISKFSVIIRHRLYPTLYEFFFAPFDDEKLGSNYAEEDWILKKSLAIWVALWLIVNWVIGAASLEKTNHRYTSSDIVFYFVVGPLLAFPVLWMVIYDWPRNRPILYQLFLLVAIWAWGFYFVLYIKICRFYAGPSSACFSRDFLGLFFYTTALQTMGLFGLKLNRLMAAIGAFSFFVMTSAFMIPEKSTWIRNMINFFVFHFFLIYVHYTWDNSDRHLYTLRYHLKIQYRASQKAQVNERKVADSKRRMNSYLLHEVQAPLNTALWAVRNMEASASITKDQQIEFNALSGSLNMTSKVLNDVLDFNKMESGNFESAPRPYAFHQVMRSLLMSPCMASDARGLIVETHLDPNIDIIARKAAYRALGENTENILKHIEVHPNIDGVVMGDEARLKQVVTHLVSNACKFTPGGGKLTVRTKLVLPGEDASNPHPVFSSKMIVVRIEVDDTGDGMRPYDMHKLFTPLNPPKQKKQDGKDTNTDLGLLLVQQIVKLSGGRLGVKSKVGRGSTIWVELPLGVGYEAVMNKSEVVMSQGSNHVGNGCGQVVTDFKLTAGMSVLVVGDDSLTRALMKKTLTRLGCHVSFAENGEVALEMLLGQQASLPASAQESVVLKREEITPRSTSTSTPTGTPDEHRYAVVFLYDQMPVASGLRVIEKLRDLGRRDFVVAIIGDELLADESTGEFRATHREYLNAGFDKVLTKPVLERNLQGVLRAADERRRN